MQAYQFSIRPFSHLEAKDLFTRIASGMAYLHSQGVFHRDLKARDVLVHEYSNSLHTKVTDFGAPNMLMFITCI
jgi:serine/threonine protein kinase